MPDAVPYPTFQEPTQQNPLQTMQGLTQLYGAQQEVRAKDAIGQIFQQSIGPDGKPDYAKAMTMMAGNPAAAWKLPEIAGQIAQRDLTAAHTTQVELQNSAARAGFLGQKAYALAMAKGKDVSGRDISSALTDGVAQGLFEPKDATMMLANISKGGLQGQGLADYLKTFGLQQQQVAQQHQIALQAWEQAFRPTEIHDELTGQKKLVPAYQVFGNAPPGLPPSMGGGGGASGGVPSAPGGVPGAGPGGSSQLPGQPQRQEVSAGPTEVQEQGLKALGPMRNQIVHDAEASGQQLRQINQARDLLEKIHETGPEREFWLPAANLARAAGFTQLADRLAGRDLSALQDFQKFTTGMAAQAALQATGGSRVTNFTEQTFLKSNANIGLTKEANKKLLDYAAQTNQLNMAKLDMFTRVMKGDVIDHETGARINPVDFAQVWQRGLRQKGLFDKLYPDVAEKLIQGTGLKLEREKPGAQP